MNRNPPNAARERRELSGAGNYRQARDSAGGRAGGASDCIRPAEHVALAVAASAHTLKASLAVQVFAMGGD
jgi:hypothetical protein